MAEPAAAHAIDPFEALPDPAAILAGDGALLRANPAFRAIIRHPELQRIPMILETPKEQEGDDRRNLDTLMRLWGPVRK